MSTTTLRRAAAATATTVGLSLVGATLASPASADDFNEDAIAAQICPGPNYMWDLDTDASGDEAETLIFTYAIFGQPDRLCTFAVIFTDEGSTINGSYHLSAGSETRNDAVTGYRTVTQPIVTTVGQASSATLTASGNQVTYEKITKLVKEKTKKKTKAQKKTAAKKYAAAVKKAKAAYKKSNKNAAAKAKRDQRIASAKKRYKAAVASYRWVKKTSMGNVVDPYNLAISLPLPSTIRIP